MLYIFSELSPGVSSDTTDLINTNTKVWGTGVAGFNVAFGFQAFSDGLSNIVAVDELRAGIDPIDPRGTWALGFVGASLTAVHAPGPNQINSGLDAIHGCTILTLTYSSQELKRRRMPCSNSAIEANFAATARSQHPGLVNILRLDGSVDSVSNSIDMELWANMHSQTKLIP